MENDALVVWTYHCEHCEHRDGPYVRYQTAERMHELHLQDRHPSAYYKWLRMKGKHHG